MSATNVHIMGPHLEYLAVSSAHVRWMDGTQFGKAPGRNITCAVITGSCHG